jgi:FKBP-type peptidyl-prolyl cis-trans isomerase FkpA
MRNIILSFFLLFCSSSNLLSESKVMQSESGLRYIDEVEGSGAEAVSGKLVTVHYTGWLLEAEDQQGTKFDSSKDRGDPFSFVLGGGQVIKGWDEGVKGMKIGGKRILLIPSDMGYGARGAGGVIPPNANLKFEVELLSLR